MDKLDEIRERLETVKGCKFAARPTINDCDELRECIIDHNDGNDTVADDIDPRYIDFFFNAPDAIRHLLDLVDERDKVISLQKEYIKLLGDELDETVEMAHIHGWKSTRYEEGKRLRELIKETENERL